VKCIARIKEASDDRPRQVDVTGHGALAWACARARRSNVVMVPSPTQMRTVTNGVRRR
jgi:hypothetical protein